MNKEVMKQEQDDSVIYIQKMIKALYENSDPVSVEAAELLERIIAKQEQHDPWLLNTAQNLAKFMAKNFYPEVTHWKVSDNLVSVILQIDNMVTGLIRKSKQEQGEPVECKRCGGSGVIDDGEIDCYEDGTPFENGLIKCVKDCPDCATPQQRKPLTDDEIWEVVKHCEDNHFAFARAIEAAHGIKE